MVTPHTFIDYLNEVFEDACRYIDKEGHWYAEDGRGFSAFYELLRVNDSVTGDLRGFYYCTPHHAEQATSRIIWSKEFHDMCAVFDIDGDGLADRSSAAVDVALRCYALGFLRSGLEDYWNKKFGEKE